MIRDGTWKSLPWLYHINHIIEWTYESFRLFWRETTIAWSWGYHNSHPMKMIYDIFSKIWYWRRDSWIVRSSLTLCVDTFKNTYYEFFDFFGFDLRVRISVETYVLSSSLWLINLGKEHERVVVILVFPSFRSRKRSSCSCEYCS